MTERQRTAINEALHELRRPLQALAFHGSVSGGDVVESSTRLAALALERIDREVNGGDGGWRSSEPVRCETALRSAVRRWRARVALGGGSLELRWRAGDAVVADGAELEQAVDNLIVNAIEHGGPEIVVEGSRRENLLRISVADSGRGSRPRSRRGGAGETTAWLGGRRRGHGLGLVRRFAVERGGRFVLRRAGDGSQAILDLPLAGVRRVSDLAA